MLDVSLKKSTRKKAASEQQAGRASIARINKGVIGLPVELSTGRMPANGSADSFVDIWDHNLHAQFERIRELVVDYHYIAMVRNKSHLETKHGVGSLRGA